MPDSIVTAVARALVMQRHPGAKPDWDFKLTATDLVEAQAAVDAHVRALEGEGLMIAKRKRVI